MLIGHSAENKSDGSIFKMDIDTLLKIMAQVIRKVTICRISEIKSQ